MERLEELRHAALRLRRQQQQDKALAAYLAQLWKFVPELPEGWELRLRQRDAERATGQGQLTTLD